MKIDGDLAELMGIQVGDGCISENKRYSELYIGGDITEEKEYHDNWVSKLFNKKVMLPLGKSKIKYKPHPKVGVYGAYIFDKEIVQFFKELGLRSGTKLNVTIPNEILLDVSLTKRFLRGLFDTDGNLYFDRNKTLNQLINKIPIIKLGTVSEPLANQVFNSLFSLGFHPRRKKPYKGKRDKNTVHTVLLYRKADINKFMKEIGFKSSKHYTKWRVFKKFGFCPPKTTLVDRKKMLLRKAL